MTRSSLLRFFGILFLFAAVFVTRQSAAWGPDGHIIVALIAESQLTDKAREALRAILDKDQTLADISNLADTKMRDSRPETKTWHYVDPPLGATAIDETQDYWASGNNVAQKIVDAAAVLKTGQTNATYPTKAQALLFLVHFVGDVHQPLHCASRNDKGGNTTSVSFLFSQASRTNLHKVWDTLILREAMGTMDAAAYAKHLLDNHDLFEKVKAEPADSTVKDWVLQSNKIATDFVYPRVPQNLRINRPYVADATPIIDQQLLRGGMRLARLLNEAFN